MIAILAAVLLSQSVDLYDEGVKLGPVRRINCTGSGIVCALASTGSVIGTITVSSGGGGGVPGSIPVVAFESSPDLSNERVLTNGTNTTVDLGTAGQAKVNLSGTVPQTLGGTGAGSITCGAGQFVTSNGTTYSCATPAGGGTSPLILSFGAF